MGYNLLSLNVIADENMGPEPRVEIKSGKHIKFTHFDTFNVRAMGRREGWCLETHSYAHSAFA